MNSSESAAKPSTYPPEFPGSGDNVQFSEHNNKPALPSSDEAKHKIDPKRNEEESIIYDLEEFKEAKKDWIKNFFYSKKNGLKKLIGLKENDVTDSQTEESELPAADAPVNKISKPEAEVSFLKGKSEFPYRKDRTVEDLQKKKEVNTETFKRIRIDLKKIKADTKQHIKVFLRTIKTANSEYITRKKIELKIFSEQQKISPARTSLTRRSEYYKFFQNFKPEVWKHFARKKEAIGEFFDIQSEQTQKIILAKKQDLINADYPDKSRKATRKYIKAQQKKLKKFVAKKEKSAKKEIKEIKQDFDKHTDAKKKSLKKLIKPDTNNGGELQALVESNRQEMKDFISSQNDIIKSLIDLNKTAPPARTFTDHNEIKENINLISPFIKTAYAVESPASTLKKPIKILVAEDDLLLRKSLSFYLSHNGFDVVQVTNGLEAMDELSKNPFDVIILDLQMPHMGGLELIDRVRNQLHLDTKIIVLTASGVEEVELKSFSMGATDFIAKPFSPSVVKARIEKIMANDAN